MIYHHSYLNCLTSGKWSSTQPNARLCMVGKSNRQFQYIMSNHTLETTSEERDLGVIVTNNLKFAGHCQSACQKANRVLGMIRRTISYKTPEILLPLYKSLVRPLVEYCVPAWSPHYKQRQYIAWKNPASLHPDHPWFQSASTTLLD